MRITISSVSETSSVLVTATSCGSVVYCEEHSPKETLWDTIKKVRSASLVPKFPALSDPFAYLNPEE